MDQRRRLLEILNERQLTPFSILLVCLSFWLTALAVRGVIFWSVTNGITPAIVIKGWHIHHFVTGFLMLSLAIVLLSKRIFSKYIPLTLLGTALGLIFDEFLYWISGNFDYWSGVNMVATITIGAMLMAVYLYTKRQDLGRLSKKRIAAMLVPIIIFSASFYLLFHRQKNWSFAEAQKNLVPREYSGFDPGLAQ